MRMQDDGMSDERVEIAAQAMFVQDLDSLHEDDQEAGREAARLMLAALESAGYEVVKLEHVGCRDLDGSLWKLGIEPYESSEAVYRKLSP